jgi:MinD-like ATPase involved in chromosome partitioning or flagellar assembly
VTTVAVCSGKGSPGATFVATNLAAALARARRDVLLLDVDPAGGDVCCYLGLDPRRGLHPLLRMEGITPEPDRLLAEAEERSGFLVLCGFPEASELASPETLNSVLAAARASRRTVVADLGRVPGASALAASEADLVVLVVRPDLVSVLGAARALRCLKTSVDGPDRVAAVVSGLERRRAGDRAEVADALGLPILGAIPLHRSGVRKALIGQAPPRTRRLKRSFDALASAVLRNLDRPAAAAKAPTPEPVGAAT